MLLRDGLIVKLFDGCIAHGLFHAKTAKFAKPQCKGTVLRISYFSSGLVFACSSKLTARSLFLNHKDT